MQILTTMDAFKNNAKEYNFLPVCAKLFCDKETPVSLYEKLVGESAGFLLESAEANRNFGRYSFLGFNPVLMLKSYKNQTNVDYVERKEEIKAAPVDALRHIMQSYKAPVIEGLPPFCGGMIGYLAYEAAATWERIRGLEIAPDEVLAQTMLCQDIVIMDHLSHQLYCIVWTDNGEEVDKLYAKACERLHELASKIVNVNETPVKKGVYAGGVVQQPDDEHYCSGVEQIKEYILAGDTYQTVLSHKFKRFLPAHPFILYRRLRSANPSPYMFYLNFGEKKIVGASPEMLVRVLDGVVTTYPIAGTRPRGKTYEEDKNLAEDLLSDKKEVAEHSMLVDLGRNDIGKVSEAGSVKVTRFKDVEYFSHVMHLVSEVQGELSQDKDAFDALKACFPAGTVSGAPKLRSMEIIAQLEKEKRGVYAGAIGYWDFNGNMDTCIAIRTMSIDDNIATVQGGAGIVADSQPASEAQEVRHKTRVLLDLLEGEDIYAYLD